MDFTILILGSDPNAYYMARCCHELYFKKVDMIGKDFMGVTEYSNIINFVKVPEIYNEAVFLETLNKYALDSKYKKIILIGANDKFVKLIVLNKDKLNKIFVFNYPTLEITNKLLSKESFYNAYNNDLNLPKTLIYSCKIESKNNNTLVYDKIKSEFQFPIILKASDGIEYNKHPFEGMSKVYKIKSFEELVDVINKIESSGYEKGLIIQEFVPGDDCALFDVVFYCGKNKKVQLMTFAQIGLQERTITGVGNCTVLLNGFNEYGYDESIINKLKEFLEKINYQGFGEFDLKYDSRDGKYKVFEINPRQARSSYYLSACNHNLVKYLVDDLIYNEEKEFTLMKDKMVLSFVSKYVIRKYVTSIPLLTEINKQIKEGRFVRPLHYSKDKNLKRFFYLLLKDLNYIIKYRKLKW